MKSSILAVFSVLKNSQQAVEKEKSLDIFRFVSKKWFDKTGEYTYRICKRIYNDIENNYYNYKDFVNFIMYQYIKNGKFKISSLITKDIVNSKKLFTKKQLEKDKEFILQVAKKSKIKDICIFFETNDEGESIIFQLTKQEYVSPCFFLRFKKRCLTNEKENVILSNDYKRFRLAMNILQKNLKGGS